MNENFSMLETVFRSVAHVLNIVSLRRNEDIHGLWQPKLVMANFGLHGKRYDIPGRKVTLDGG